MLTLADVHAYYGKSHVLQGVCLEVGQGELVALLGRNGVGKTTTLRTILGLLRSRGGEIHFNGRPLVGLAAHRIPRLGIGYVPQGRQIFPGLTVRENLLLALVEDSRKGAKLQDRLEGVFAYFPALANRVGQLAGTLSGGEQQMLAIARAMMTSPRLILMDEPTEGLMPRMVELVKETVLHLHQRGVSVLLVEQKAKAALDICPRAYVMQKGQIVFRGTSRELAQDAETQLRYLGVTM